MVFFIGLIVDVKTKITICLLYCLHLIETNYRLHKVMECWNTAQGILLQSGLIGCPPNTVFAKYVPSLKVTWVRFIQFVTSPTTHDKYVSVWVLNGCELNCTITSSIPFYGRVESCGSRQFQWWFLERPLETRRFLATSFLQWLPPLPPLLNHFITQWPLLFLLFHLPPSHVCWYAQLNRNQFTPRPDLVCKLVWGYIQPRPTICCLTGSICAPNNPLTPPVFHIPLSLVLSLRELQLRPHKIALHATCLLSALKVLVLALHPEWKATLGSKLRFHRFWFYFLIPKISYPCTPA